MRSPHQIVMALAYALKESKKGEENKVADLSKKTGLHYVTTDDYLNLIEYVQNNIPRLQKIGTKGNARVIITNEIEDQFPPNEKTLLNIFDKGAFSEETAIQLSDYERNYIGELLENEYTIQTDDQFYLTTQGIIKAAGIAGKRAEKVTSLEVVQESEEYLHREYSTWKADGFKMEKRELYAKNLPVLNSESVA